MIKNNLKATTFSFLVNLLIQLATIPLFIHFKGKTQYSNWIMLWSIPTLISFAELGLGVNAANFMHINISKKKLVRFVFNSSFSFVFLIAFVVTISVSICALLLDFNKFLNINDENQHYLYLSFNICLFYSFMNVITSVPISFYRSIEKYTRSVYIVLYFKILEFIGLILYLIYFDFSFLFILSIYVFLKIIMFCFIFFDLKYHYNFQSFYNFSFRFGIVKKLTIPTLATLVTSFTQTGISQILVVMAKIKLGEDSLIIFTTYRTFANFIKQITNIVNVSYWPEYTRLYSEKKYSVANQLVRSIAKKSMILSLFISIAIVFCFKFVYPVWTMNSIQANLFLFILFVISVNVEVFYNVYWTFLMSINKHFKASIYYLFVSFLAILSSFVSIYFIKLYSIPLSFILTGILFSFVLVKIYNQIINNEL